MALYAQKSLGQNFLKSKWVIDLMVEAGKIDSHDIIVEAGPGKGILTEGLLACTRQVIAIEKDPRLILFNQLKFKNEIAAGALKLIEGDVMEFDPASEELQAGGYKVIANIPYYLTGHFLRYFLSHQTPPSRMVLLLQREVVDRIMARDGKESMLSIAVKVFGTPKYIEKVPREMFSPKPRVDSAVLLIENITKDSFKHIDANHFFAVLRAGFAQKRKKLLNNLSAIAPKESVTEIFKKLSLSENVRAEELPVSKWKQLAQVL